MKSVIYYKDIPSFVCKIINHIGFQYDIIYVKKLYKNQIDIENNYQQKIKNYLDCYIYLLNNTSITIRKELIEKSIFILNNQKVKLENVDKNIKEFLSIKKKIDLDKIIKLASDLSLNIKLKTDCYIYYFMILNYLLIYYGYNAIKLFEKDLVIFDEEYKKYKNNENNNLKQFILRKINESKKLDKNYYKELKEIKLEEIISYIKDNEDYIKGKFKIDSLALFGSFVKNEDSIDSDIDVIVIFDEFTPLIKKLNYIEELKEMLFVKFKRLVDVHEERDIISDIRLIKNNIKIF